VTSVEIKTPEGKTDGSVDLPAEIFDVQANVALMRIDLPASVDVNIQ